MRGFTLLEILIYIALFSILMTGFVSAAAVIGESSYRISARARQLDEETFLLQRLRHAAEYASAIEISSVENGNSLVTFTDDSSQIEYFTANNTLIESHNHVSQTLVGKGIAVPVFTCAATSSSALPSLHCLLSLTLYGGPGIVLTETSTLMAYPANL